MALFLSFSSQAQSELKGPQAKNNKFWKNPLPAKHILVTQRTPLTGPLVKNNQSWEQKTITKAVIYADSKRERVTGPKAKNTKPWSSR